MGFEGRQIFQLVVFVQWPWVYFVLVDRDSICLGDLGGGEAEMEG